MIVYVSHTKMKRYAFRLQNGTSEYVRANPELVSLRQSAGMQIPIWRLARDH